VRPAIATVVGPYWESELVDHARMSGLARLVGRCRDAAGLADLASRADAVFIGSDVHWLPETDLRSMVGSTRLIGVATDGPGARLLDRVGVDEIIDASTPPDGMLSLVMLGWRPERGKLVEVTGPRGAPGRSEVALAFAYSAPAVDGIALVEIDHAGPSLGLRMGLPPSSWPTTHRVEGVTLIPTPVGVDPVRVDQVLDLITTTVLHSNLTIVDAGPDSTLHRMTDIDEAVIVGEATDTGVVRLARLCEAWLGPTPHLVINRHQPDQDLRRVARATGLEPAAVIPKLPSPSNGSLPPARMRSALRGTTAQRTAL
jgi:hypothetical protein